MISRPGTWAELAVGLMVEDKIGSSWTVLEIADGWVQMRSRNGTKKAWKIPAPETPLTIVEPTEQEALIAAESGLGAKILTYWHDRENVTQLAKVWQVPPFPLKGRGGLESARSHVEWYHGAYARSVDDEGKGGFRTLKQITEAHDQMHAEDFMANPHTHKEK